MTILSINNHNHKSPIRKQTSSTLLLFMNCAIQFMLCKTWSHGVTHTHMSDLPLIMIPLLPLSNQLLIASSLLDPLTAFSGWWLLLVMLAARDNWVAATAPCPLFSINSQKQNEWHSISIYSLFLCNSRKLNEGRMNYYYSHYILELGK